MTVEQIGKFPDFYCCYLLKSVPKPRSYYIGSTPNPVRRLRQHNGDLKAGGAYRTKRQGFRPWKIIAIVYGFPSKISALQFEHAWQHPYQTRHIPADLRITKSKSSGSSIDHKLGNLKLLLKSNGFTYMNLRVELFHREAYSVWNRDKFRIKLPDHIYIGSNIIPQDAEPSIVESGNYDQLKTCMDRENEREVKYLQNSLATWQEKLESSGAIDCDVCLSEITVDDHKAVCIHKPCDSITHISCLAERMITIPQSNGLEESRSESESESDGEVETQLQSQKKKKPAKKTKKSTVKQSKTAVGADTLIPLSGKCPKCSKVNVWINIVKNSSRLNQEINKQQLEKNDIRVNK